MLYRFSALIVGFYKKLLENFTEKVFLAVKYCAIITDIKSVRRKNRTSRRINK